MSFNLTQKTATLMEVSGFPRKLVSCPMKGEGGGGQKYSYDAYFGPDGHKKISQSKSCSSPASF